MNDVPTAGARDLGGPPWERALVRRIREKNLAWTSEKTCRAWRRRFLASVDGKPLDELDHQDVRGWLSDLAAEKAEKRAEGRAIGLLVGDDSDVVIVGEAKASGESADAEGTQAEADP